jgi:hypothetical protein
MSYVFVLSLFSNSLKTQTRNQQYKNQQTKYRITDQTTRDKITMAQFLSHPETHTSSTAIWKTSTIPFPEVGDPIDYGWKFDIGQYKPMMTKNKATPTAILGLGCKSNGCSCKQNKLPCTGEDVFFTSVPTQLIIIILKYDVLVNK